MPDENGKLTPEELRERWYNTPGKEFREIIIEQLQNKENDYKVDWNDLEITVREKTYLWRDFTGVQELIERENNPRDLRGVDFAGLHLDNTDLGSAHLENANLESAHLVNAYLGYAYFENANLGIAFLEHSNLRSARFKHANLESAHLEHTNLESAHLEHADLRDAHLEYANLRNAHFEKADLNGAHLENAKLNNARLENAKLNGTHLENANLWYAHLEHADLRDAHLESANLYKANLENANLRSAHLENAELVFAHLENAYLFDAHFENANLRSAHLENAELAYARFEYANLGYANFENAKLSHAQLKHADFAYAHLKHADLSNANLKYAILGYSHLENAELNGAKFLLKSFWWRVKELIVRLKNKLKPNLAKITLFRKIMDFLKINYKQPENLNDSPDRPTILTGAELKNVKLDSDPVLYRDLLDEQYLDAFAEKHKILYPFWLLTSNCGRWTSLVFCWALFFTLLFGFIYSHCYFIYFGKTYHLWWHPYYFSVVTMTTLGMSSVEPVSHWAAFIHTIENIIGFGLLGYAIAVLGSKFTRRSA